MIVVQCADKQAAKTWSASPTECSQVRVLGGTHGKRSEATIRPLIRENALYLSWLADDFVQLDDIDQAASLGTRLAELASRTNSARATDRLEHVARLLVPYQSSAPVREFFEAYSSVGNS